jgi:hypothetical protein
MKPFFYTPFAAVLLIIGSPPAYGQQSDDFVITGALIASATTKGEGEEPCGHDVCGALGGRTSGVVMGARRKSAANLELGAEISVTRSLETDQRVGYTDGRIADVLTRHRDTTVSGIVAWAPFSTAAITFIGGGGLVVRHTTRKGPFFRILPPFTQGELAETLTNIRVGVLRGADLPIRLAAHMFLTPTFRLHYVFDSDNRADGFTERGVGSVIARAGVGVGIPF